MSWPQSLIARLVFAYIVGGILLLWAMDALLGMVVR